MEAELARMKEKCGFLEEKVLTLKEDFKLKERESQEAFEKKVTVLDEKVVEFRSRLKRRDEEYNELSQALKEEKRVTSDKSASIESLEKRMEVLQQEMEAQVKLAQQQAKVVEERTEEERRRFAGELEDSQRSLCTKEMEVRELQSQLEQAAEVRADLEGDKKKLQAVKMELEEQQRNAAVRIATLEQDSVQKTDVNTGLQDNIRQLQSTVEAHLKELAVKANCIDQLELTLRRHEEKYVELVTTSERNISELRDCISTKESEISRLREELTNCKNVLAGQQQEIEAMSVVIKDKTLSHELLKACNREIQENLNRAMEMHKEELMARDNAIQDLNSRLHESTSTNEKLTRQIKELEEEIAGLRSLVASLKDDLELKKKEYEAKEAELNWIYEQKLQEANHETQQKVEILRLQEEKLSEIQLQLLGAKQSAEEKDLEIYRREDSIRRLEAKLLQSREEVANKEQQLEEKEQLLSNLNTSLSQSHEGLQEKERVLQVSSCFS